MPPLREWLPEDHLAWFVIEAVDEIDLTEFYAEYRADGHGRAAHEPLMVVALLLYAYATEQRSARAIERHCRQDIAYRVITANQVLDHATIARFVARHEAALGELFGSVLVLCATAALVSTGRSRRGAVDRARWPTLANGRSSDEAEVYCCWPYVSAHDGAIGVPPRARGIRPSPAKCRAAVLHQRDAMSTPVTVDPPLGDPVSGSR